MKLENKYLAVFGLSMALLMATMLFVMVGVNPKKESYQMLPWLYSSITAISSIALWIWSKTLESQIELEESLVVNHSNQ